MTDLEPFVDALARELWEAYATYNQVVIPFPTLHWDELDLFSQNHWRHIARTALAFRPPLRAGTP